MTGYLFICARDPIEYGEEPAILITGDAVEENHPLPERWISELIYVAKENGSTIDRVICGLCVDERGGNKAATGT
jgi:hypothetical protein